MHPGIVEQGAVYCISQTDPHDPSKFSMACACALLTRNLSSKLMELGVLRTNEILWFSHDRLVMTPAQFTPVYSVNHLNRGTFQGAVMQSLL